MSLEHVGQSEFTARVLCLGQSIDRFGSIIHSITERVEP